MAKLINYFFAKIKTKEVENHKLLLNKGLTWKTLNPKSLLELETEN